LEQLALEMFGEGDPHTPAFSRKSVEGIEWKGVVKHSWREERGIGSKTGNEGCTGRKGEIWREWGIKLTMYYNTGIVKVK
jgi:hypothetical protein